MDNTLYFFGTLRRMCGYRGDTFPVFYIETDADDLTGCTMRLVIEDMASPGSVALVKACTEHEFPMGVLGYEVQLVSSETAQLCGTYTLHFILDNGTDEMRKLVGTLQVLDIPKEVL